MKPIAEDLRPHRILRTFVLLFFFVCALSQTLLGQTAPRSTGGYNFTVASPAAADPTVAPSDPDAQPLDNIVPAQVLVRFRPKVSRVKQNVIVSPLAAKVEFFQRPYRGVQLHAATPAEDSVFEQLAWVKLQPHADVAAAIQQLQRHADVLYAEPNYRLRLANTTDADGLRTAGVLARSANLPQRLPDDFELDKLWNFNNTGQSGGRAGADIQALAAWSLATGDERIVVAIVDTGTDYFHPDLAANIWVNRGEIPGNGVDDDANGYVDDVHGYDFVSADGDPMDDHVHGTHIAGTIGAVGDNRIGVAGLCWKVRLMPLKTFDESGQGDTANAIQAIRYAIANGARIINASWGSNDRSRALEDVILEADRAGVLIVAAAGNEKTDVPLYPAAYGPVLAVAATDMNDQRAMFSNYGFYVDVSAPGDNIFSTIPNGGYDFLSGTSMATPHVAGLAALIWSKSPRFTHRDVENIIRNTTDPLSADRYIGSGRINAYKAAQIDSALPTAKLELPEVISGNITIRGTAAGENFAGYSLAYGKGMNPTNWTELYRSSTSVSQGVLFEPLATPALEEGTHSIRLRVESTRGHAATAQAIVRVRNAAIHFPMNNDLLRAGTVIPIRGTVFGPNRTYTIQYGVGWQPTTWSDQGITLVDGGRNPILNGQLATWDTRSAAKNEFYSLKLTVKSGDQIVSEDIVQLVYLDGQLKEGWPQYVSIHGEHPTDDWRNLQIADLDGDKRQELILVNHGNTDETPAQLLVYRHDGQLWWSRELATGAPYSDIPVVGDVDDDGLLEIFVDVGAKGQLFAFKFDGTPLEGNWPVQLEATNLGKVLADLDGDGFKELIGFAQNPVERGGSNWKQLVVFDRRGAVLRKWDIRACDRSVDAPKMFPAVGNLNADPALEIVLVTGCSELAAYSLTNAIAPLWTAAAGGTLFASPVIGDLNNDGSNEIVIGAYNYMKSSPGGLYVFDRNGKRERGWPVLLDESFSTSAALADFNGDGKLEIAILSESQKLHLVGQNGFEMPGWPVGPIETLHAKSSPVIGDIDNDSSPDVLVPLLGYWFTVAVSGDFSHVGGVRAWSFDGKALELNGKSQWPALVMESSSAKSWFKAAPVTLADLDNNGKLDVIATSIHDRSYAPLGQLSFRKNRSSIYVWELDAPFVEEKVPWPSFRQNAQHTGFFQLPPKKNQPPQIAEIPHQTVRVGRAFYAIELDQYVEDPDHKPAELSWRITGGQQIRVSVDANRVATFVPVDPEWIGRQTLQFTVTDPGVLTSSIAVHFEVRTEYEPPVAQSDRFTTIEDSAIEIEPLLNDTHPAAEPLLISNVSLPPSGTVKRLPNKKLLYTPHPDFHGTDRFNYTISDGKGGMAIGTVRIDVSPVNDPPFAAADEVITLEDTPIEVDLLANDVDVDGDAISLVEFSSPKRGTVKRSSGGQILYSPDADFFGLEKLTYVVRDAQGATNSGAITIMVKPVNDVPLAKDQAFTLNKHASINLDFLAKDNDGDQITFTVLKSPEHGSLLAYPTVATYTPHGDFVGKDSFTYKASDGQSESTVATVSFEVLDANNPPTTGDLSLTTRRGQPVKITLSAKDLDNDPVTFELVSRPAHGTLDGGGSNYVYRPTAGYLGNDEFKFHALDPQSTSKVATVKLRMTDQNSAPIAKHMWVDVKMNSATNLLLLATDGESDPLKFFVLTNPISGTLSGTAPDVIYTPKRDFTGPDRFAFKVNDGELESEVGIVSLNIKFPNSPPAIQEQTLNLPKDQRSPIVLAVSDPDGDPLKSAILKGPKQGRIAGAGTNFVYTPKPGFVGTDTFTYKIWDGHTYSKIGKVTLNVAAASPSQGLAFESITSLPGRQMRLVLRTEPGKNIAVQTSTNLVDWTPLTTKLSDGTSTTILDTNATSTVRYYRATQF